MKPNRFIKILRAVSRGKRDYPFGYNDSVRSFDYRNAQRQIKFCAGNQVGVASVSIIALFLLIEDPHLWIMTYKESRIHARRIKAKQCVYAAH